MGYILTDTSPAYELVGDITVSSATTSVSFTGLNFTSADDLLLVSDITNASINNSGYIFMYVNGNTTNSNYYNQNLYASSTGVGTIGRLTVPIYSEKYANGKTLTYGKIKLTNSGYFVYQAESSKTYGSSSIERCVYYGTSTFTSSSITQITLTSNLGATIGIGSRFRLYKLVAEKVADITVSTATTSVNITGLSIDKGSEYMLVSDVVNNTNGSWNSLFFNNNTNSTSYYIQQMGANGTFVDGGRENTSNFNYNPTANKNMIYTNIKLTNNGNIVAQISDSRMYGGSSISITNYSLTNTFTATSISQLAISSSVTNGIGVGSRFQLYKLR